MPPDLIAQGAALESCLTGLRAALLPYLADPNQQLAIASRGQPDCLPVLLLRPALGEDKVPGQKCVFTTTWVISAYWDLSCGLAEAHAAIYTLMSGCAVAGSILSHLSDRENLAPLRAIGVGIQKFEPPRGFSLTPYAYEGPPNTFWAQLPVTLTYSC